MTAARYMHGDCVGLTMSASRRYEKCGDGGDFVLVVLAVKNAD